MSAIGEVGLQLLGEFRLLASPLLTGAIMDRYGEWRERRGSTRSYLATFWGGALFAFGMALVRFVWVSMGQLETAARDNLAMLM